MKTRILIGMIVVLVLAVAYCGWRYYGEVIKPEQQIAAADAEQNAIFTQVKPVIQPDSAQTEGESLPTGESGLLAPAEAVNENTTAWLTIPGTHIDYPVVQGEDNDFYLHHGFDGQPNQELGCPFLDCRCASDYSGFNSIVYAHHMTGQRMFADIALYKDETFFCEHASGSLILNDTVHTVRFFAYLNVPSTAQLYEVRFAEDDEKRAYLDYIKNTALYCTEPDISENSHLLLLSTCTFEYEEARGVLVGVIE